MSNIGKRIELLTSSAWWDEGERTVVLEEDEHYIYFETADRNYCSLTHGSPAFKYLPKTENQEYYQKNRGEVLEQKKKYREELRETVVTALGSRCRECGFDKPYALDVKGGGGRGKAGYTTYLNRALNIVRLTPSQTDYYLMCANCQRKDGTE
jgi:hypothetical protein